MYPVCSHVWFHTYGKYCKTSRCMESGVRHMGAKISWSYQENLANHQLRGYRRCQGVRAHSTCNRSRFRSREGSKLSSGCSQRRSKATWATRDSGSMRIPSGSDENPPPGEFDMFRASSLGHYVNCAPLQDLSRDSACGVLTSRLEIGSAEDADARRLRFVPAFLRKQPARNVVRCSPGP